MRTERDLSAALRAYDGGRRWQSGTPNGRLYTGSGAVLSIVRLDSDVMAESFFPHELSGVLNNMRARTRQPQLVRSFMLPAWPVWFPSGPGPDPAPIYNQLKVQNIGP